MPLISCHALAKFDCFCLRVCVLLLCVCISISNPQDENNQIQSRKYSKVKGRTCSANVQLIRSLSPPRKKPLILKGNDFNYNSNGNNNDSSVSSPTTMEVKAGGAQVFSVVLMGKLKVETAVCPQQDGKSQTGPILKHTDAASRVNLTSSDPSSGGLTVGRSDAQVKRETEEPVCDGPALTAVPHDPSASFTGSTSRMDTTVTAATAVVGLGVGSSQTGLTGHQSITVSPIMCLQADDEQEGGELVTSEAPRETEAEGSPDKDEVEMEGEGEGEHTYLCEHSYSRQDLDHEQLWSRIAALHAKITELDQREGETLAKIQVAEAQLTQLRKENIVCEEKQKALEEYFTSVFLQ